jgi:5-methylcytosine-specific restriction enzyme A
MSEWPYNTAQWQKVRRLKFQQNRLCEMCLKQGRIEIAVAVDHIISIASGGDAFPPLDMLMSLCASCHNRKTRVVEQQGKELTVKGCDVNGMPLDPTHPWFKSS